MTTLRNTLAALGITSADLEGEPPDGIGRKDATHLAPGKTEHILAIFRFREDRGLKEASSNSSKQGVETTKREEIPSRDQCR